MTRFDIFAQIISEASGKPIEQMRTMSDIIFKLSGASADKLHQELPDAEAAALLAKLRTGLPGVRRWLIEGRLMMEADIAQAEGKLQ